MLLHTCWYLKSKLVSTSYVYSKKDLKGLPCHKVVLKEFALLYESSIVHIEGLLIYCLAYYHSSILAYIISALLCHVIHFNIYKDAHIYFLKIASIKLFESKVAMYVSILLPSSSVYQYVFHILRISSAY